MQFPSVYSTKWLHNPYFLNNCTLITPAVCSALKSNLCHAVYPLTSSLIHCISVFPIHMCMPYCFTGWLWRTSCGTRRWCPHFGWCCIIRYWVWFKIFSWSLFKSVSLHRLDKESPQINTWCLFLCRVCVTLCVLIVSFCLLVASFSGFCYLWLVTQYNTFCSVWIL